MTNFKYIGDGTKWGSQEKGIHSLRVRALYIIELAREGIIGITQ